MAFKQVNVKLLGESPKVLKIDVKKKGEVTAGDFIPDAEVEIVNRDLVICTLTEERAFQAEVTVQRGRGLCAC